MTPQIVTVYVILAILILALSGFFAFLGYRIWHNNPIEAFKSLFRVNEERMHPDRQLKVRAGFFYLFALYTLVTQVCNILSFTRMYIIQLSLVLASGILGILYLTWAKKK